MKNIFTLLGLLLWAFAIQAEASSNRIKGTLSGFVSGKDDGCYIAFVLPNAIDNGTYYYIRERSMCTFALAIYVLRGTLVAHLEEQGGGRAKEVTTLEALRGNRPAWPPYPNAGTQEHYRLLGFVEAYQIVKNHNRCYTSIEGSGPYSNAYHEAVNAAVCVALLEAYLRNAEVSVSADRNPSGGNNRITAVELGPRDKAYWPPYGIRDK